MRWERLRELWWLWFILGLSGGVALALWLSPVLNAPSVTWIGFPAAVDAFVPADLSHDYEKFTKRWKELSEQVDQVNAEIRAKPQSSGAGFLQARLKDLENQTNGVHEKWWAAQEAVIKYLQEQL